MDQNNNRIMSVKDWVITLILLIIPIVNIVLLFVWAFGEGNIIRKNYAKAQLIMVAIAIALYIIFVILSFIFVFSFTGY
ncbi:hypothetical protein [Bacillus sp. JJ722]|uniref:hypothetical protein n=1 Tax=Bacillus sp. JJ722 TaxID=3122973 RepID=UPI002FFF6806